MEWVTLFIVLAVLALIGLAWFLGGFGSRAGKHRREWGD